MESEPLWPPGFVVYRPEGDIRGVPVLQYGMGRCTGVAEEGSQRHNDEDRNVPN